MQKVGSIRDWWTGGQEDQNSNESQYNQDEKDEVVPTSDIILE